MTAQVRYITTVSFTIDIGMCRCLSHLHVSFPLGTLIMLVFQDTKHVPAVYRDIPFEILGGRGTTMVTALGRDGAPLAG